MPINILDNGLPFVFHCLPSPTWQNLYIRSKYVLHGKANVIRIAFDYEKRLEPLLELLKKGLPAPALFIDHAFAYTVGEWFELVKNYPKYTFLSVNHSSPNGTAVWDGHFDLQADVIKNSKKFENYYCASTDSRIDLREYGVERGRIFHNPVALIEDSPSPEPSPPCFIIVARPDPLKGVPSHLMAMKLIAKKIPEARFVRVMYPIAWREWAFAESLGINVEFRPVSHRRAWYKFLKNEVTILAHSTLGDSFNLTSIDACLNRRPFVGSFSIPHTPKDWEANPADPEDIAAKALYLLENYKEHSNRARELAESVANKNNNLYKDLIFSLLKAAGWSGSV